MDAVTLPEYERTIGEICALDWAGLTRHDLVNVAWAYYFFSVQFRENLKSPASSIPTT